MTILYLLEDIRTPLLNNLVSLITHLGSEVFLLVGSLVVLWTIDKKWGYYLLFVASVGTTTNQFLKNLFAVARPWIIDPEFTVVEQAKAGATGYSFPSGHTQTAVGFFGGIIRLTDHRLIRMLSLFMILAVSFSRMYLGVHTVYDVGVSILIGFVLVVLIHPIFFKYDKVYHSMIIGTIIALLYVIYMEVKLQNAVMSEIELDALKNAYTVFGLALAIPVIYHVDTKYLKYPTEAVWWAQLVKCIIGLSLMLTLRIVLKQPLYVITNGHNIADMIRYFILAVSGGLLWPITFKWFKRLS